MNDPLRTLYPQIVHTKNDKAFDIDGNEVIYDKDAVQAFVDSFAYQQKRANEYPSFAEQFDTIFHDGIDAWKAQIQAIKDKYPKGAA